MTDVLAAEWLKIRTIRSTWYVLAAVAGTIGLVALVAWSATLSWDRLPPSRRADVAGISSLVDVAGWGVSLCLAVLGVLTVSSEYGTGLIRSTFVAMPNRRAVLAGKAIVVACVAYVMGQLAAISTNVLTRLIIGDRPIPGRPGTITHDLGGLVACALSVTMFALIGLGLTALTRSAVVAIATLLALWYFLPMVAINLPRPWDDRMSSLMPLSLGGELARTGLGYSDGHAALGPIAAAALMIGYSVVPLIAAMVFSVNRDTR